MYSKRHSIHPAKSSLRTHFPTAIECLESRIAPAAVISTVSLNGIGNGAHKTAVHFIDASGDNVDVVISGHGYFDITLDGNKANHADINNITIDSATANSTLTVKVSSRAIGLIGSATAVTPGVANVNSITSNYTGAMKGVTLRSASVQDIELGGVGLSGGLVLDVVNASRADHINEVAYKNGGTQYAPLAPGVDLNTVDLASAGSVVIRGLTPLSGHNNDTGSNDFDGSIDVTGALGKLIGLNSALNGSVTAGTLGGVSVSQLEGSLTTAGDMTLDLKSLDSGATVDVGGNLALRLGYATGSSSQSGLYGDITVQGSVSGLAAGTADAIFVHGDFNGSMNAGGEIASLTIMSGGGLTKGQFNGSLGSQGDIGSISARGGFSGDASVSANGSIGDITSQGTVSGLFSAGNDIGNINASVTTHGADAISGATFMALGNIGSVTAQSFDGSAIHNTTIHAVSGSIDQTDATVSHITGGDAILNVTYAAGQGTVGTVNAFSAGGNGISGFTVNAGRVLDINGTAGPASAGDGIQHSSITSAGSIGDVNGQAVGPEGANGIHDVTLQANGVFFDDIVRMHSQNAGSWSAISRAPRRASAAVSIT